MKNLARDGARSHVTSEFLRSDRVVREGGLLDVNQPLFADLKVGSSEAGNAPSESSHHPVRSGIVRPYSLTGHRHEAEVRQTFAAYGELDVRMVITSVEMVRGAAAAVHVTLPTGLEERELWKCYRSAWRDEPFVRLVHERAGLHRHPEPRLLAGTNYVDVGWAYDPDTGRAVLLCAIDNLGKGAAGPLKLADRHGVRYPQLDQDLSFIDRSPGRHGLFVLEMAVVGFVLGGVGFPLLAPCLHFGAQPHKQGVSGDPPAGPCGPCIPDQVPKCS